MPSPKHGTDSDHNPFELIVGVTLPRWRGVNKQGSPAFPADYQLRDGVNIRAVQGGYTERGGQEKLNASDIGEIEGIFEGGDRGAPGVVPILPGFPLPPIVYPLCTPYSGGERLYIVVGGNNTGLASCWSWDGATLVKLSDANVNGYSHTMIKFGTCLLAAAGPHDATSPATLRKISPSTGVTATWATAFTGATNDVPNQLLLVTDGDGTDKLLIAVATALGAGVLLSTVDGTVYVTEFTGPTSGNATALIVKRAQDGLVYLATHRDVSSRWGVWQRAASGGSFVELGRDFAMDLMLACRSMYVNGVGRLLVGGFSHPTAENKIWGFPGPTDSAILQEMMTLGLGSGATNGVTCLMDFGGNTFFGFTTNLGAAQLAHALDSGGSSGFGTLVYDLDFSSAFPSDSLNTITSLAVFAGSLYALVEDTTVPNHAYLYKSNGANTASWTKVGEVSDASSIGDLSWPVNQHIVVG